MVRSILALSIVGASLFATGAAHAQSYSPAPAIPAGVFAPVAPPAPRVEVRGPAPSASHVWCDGHWGWNGASYAWNAGRWAVPPSVGVSWTPAQWTNDSGRWRFVDGGWRGNYGYGRPGYGYDYNRYGGGYGHGGYGAGYGPRHNAVFVPGRWVWRGQWVWMPGHWTRRF